jgi:RNA polymerase sigma factor (sigma-70 family)
MRASPTTGPARPTRTDGAAIFLGIPAAAAGGAAPAIGPAGSEPCRGTNPPRAYTGVMTMPTPRAIHDGPKTRPGRGSSGPGSSGEPAAWTMCVDECESTITRVLRRFSLQDTDRDDCRQAIWEAILTTRSARFGGGDPSAWLATLARNKAIDFLRRRRRFPHHSLLVEAVRATAGDPERDRSRARSTVWAALIELEARSDPRSFLVFFLRWIEGWSIREAAEVLGLDPVQARQRHHRMKAKFRDMIELCLIGKGPSMRSDAAP